MKKGLLYSIVALAAIIIVASFNMQLGNMNPQNAATNIAQDLYVCPIANQTWDSVSQSLYPFIKWIMAGFFFGLVLLLFGWGWQLYQNLLADKFKRDAFKNIWTFTKWGFWALVVVMLILITPNNFRRINIGGDSNHWMLCEATDDGARAIRATAVQPR
ncbi:MAG: hypothetical protein J6S74_01860 [Alphaproteobacteria bacterium]|nr:hypothetical protein [Alphaproteobacteria bacterium]